MSKKDYIALAQALVDARAAHSGIGPQDYTQAERTLTLAAGKIADVLGADSARFDRERFLRAALLGDFSAPKRVRA